jgi:predicted MFS family arabinose efflux permease
MMSHSSSTPWRIAGFLALAAGLNYADRAAMSSVLAALKVDLQLSDVALGLLGSIFLWSYALSSLVAGNVADRYSRSRIVVWSLFSWSLVTALTGMVSSYYPLLILRALLGVSESLYLPAAIALLADHHNSTTRGTAMSVHSVGLNLGVIAGGAAAGYMAERWGWRSGFWCLGAVGVALAFSARAFLVDGPARTSVRPVRASYGAALSYLVRVPSYYVLITKGMLAGVAVWIFFNWLPLYFREAFNMTLGAAGFAGTFSIQMTGVLGMATGGWTSDRVAQREPRRRMLFQAWCYFAAAPFLLLFTLHPGFALVALAVAAFSFFRQMGSANENPTLCDVVPVQLRSTSVGIMNTAAAGAGGLGVAMAGFLKQSWGLNLTFAALSVLFLVAGFILLAGYWFFMPRDVQRARDYEARGGVAELKAVSASPTTQN